MATPNIAPSPETPAPAPAPTVQVDTQLASLFKSSEQTWADVITYIRTNLPKEELIRDAIIRVTLMTSKENGGRGLTKESANTELSRIRGYLLEKNQGLTDQFVNGQITMAEFRKLAKGDSTKGRKSKEEKEKEVKAEDKYKFALDNAASFAVNVFPRTRDQFLVEAGLAFDNSTKAKAELDAHNARQAAKEQGSFTPENAQQAQSPAKHKGGAKAA